MNQIYPPLIITRDLSRIKAACAILLALNLLMLAAIIATRFPTRTQRYEIALQPPEAKAAAITAEEAAFMESKHEEEDALAGKAGRGKP